MTISHSSLSSISTDEYQVYLNGMAQIYSLTLMTVYSKVVIIEYWHFPPKVLKEEKKIFLKIKMILHFQCQRAR